MCKNRISGEMTFKELVAMDVTVDELAKTLMEMYNFSSVDKPMQNLPEKNLNQRSAEILQDLGVRTNILGYQCLKYAIEIVYNDQSVLRGVIKRLYTAVAKEFNTTPYGVERAIRYAIESGLDRIEPSIIEKYFGNTISFIKDKPTNAEFIFQIVEILHNEDEIQ